MSEMDGYRVASISIIGSFFVGVGIARTGSVIQCVPRNRRVDGRRDGR